MNSNKRISDNVNNAKADFTQFDITKCSIFSERDTSKEKIKTTIPLRFKSIIDVDDFHIPAMLYEPENANKNVMLYFHGGGWVMGSLESHDSVCRKIANTLNIRVISVEYRLAPKHRFPIALNDALSSYCGLFEEKLIEFDKIILSGDSSGGNLCAALCIKLSELKFQTLPAFQVLFYPVLSNDFSSDSFEKFGCELNLTKSMAQWFVYTYTGKNPEDEEMLRSKFLYPALETDMSVFPETFIVSAGKDVLLDGQSLFISKLQKANIKNQHIIINEAKHGFMSYGKDHSKYADMALKLIKNNIENRKNISFKT